MHNKSSFESNRIYSEYDKFMHDIVVETKQYKESPHLLISKSFHTIAQNSIILKNPIVDMEGKYHRKIFYEIDEIGKI